LRRIGEYPQFLEVIPTARKPPHHIGTGDIVPALFAAGGNTPQCDTRKRQAKEDEFDTIARCFPPFQTAEKHQAAQSGLAGEIGTCLGESVEFG
jgi:hypothetical protein